MPEKHLFLVKHKYILVSILGCIIIYGWFIFILPIGIGRADEAFYLTLSQSLDNGFHFIIDIWDPQQFLALFLYVPYILFVKLTGGTDGVILYMRYLYLGISFLTYWYITFKLRKTPLRGFICAFLFCGFVPFSVFFPNYYSLPLIFMIIICFVLTDNRGKRFSLRLFFAGVLMAFSVLLLPGLTLLWILYTVLVAVYCLILRKKHRFNSFNFLLSGKVWIGLFSGVLFTAAAFLLFLIKTGGIKETIRNLPNLFSGTEYDFSLGGNVLHFFADKIVHAVKQFHPIGTLAAVLLLLFTAIFLIQKKTMKKPVLLQLAIFVICCVVGLFSCVYALIGKFKSLEGLDFMLYHADRFVPLLIVSFIFYLLCEHKNEKALLFIIVGFSVSFCQDILSDVSFGIGSVLSVFAIVELFPQLTSEIKAAIETAPMKEKQRVNTRRLIKIVVMASITFFFCWGIVNVFIQSEYAVCEMDAHGVVETVSEEPISVGPYKGIRTSSRVRNKYVDSINDLDTISKKTEGPVYVSMLHPYCYLYLNHQNTSSVYSTWLIRSDVVTRQILYWKLFPERRPEIIYVPDYLSDFSEGEYPEMVFEEVKPFIKYSEIAGKAGRIVIVEEWNI